MNQQPNMEDEFWKNEVNEYAAYMNRKLFVGDHLYDYDDLSDLTEDLNFYQYPYALVREYQRVLIAIRENTYIWYGFDNEIQKWIQCDPPPPLRHQIKREETTIDLVNK